MYRVALTSQNDQFKCIVFFRGFLIEIKIDIMHFSYFKRCQIWVALIFSLTLRWAGLLATPFSSAPVIKNSVFRQGHPTINTTSIRPGLRTQQVLCSQSLNYIP